METLKKGLNYGKHSTKPRLERRNANRSIDYDLSGSNRRRKSKPSADGDGESESDASNHSHDDWPLDEFSVHGRDGVEEMNNMFRYLGLPGPANLGITRDAWDAVKQSPPGGQYQGSGEFPGQEGSSRFFFVPEPDRYSLQPTPSRKSFLSPREPPAQAFSSSAESSPKRSLSLDGGSALLRTMNASAHGDSPAEAAPQPSRDDNGTFRRVTHDFSNVVRQAVAQAHRIEADDAAVTSFIDLHRVDDYSRSESWPGRNQSPRDPLVSSRDSRDVIQPSESNELEQLSLVRPDDTALVPERKLAPLSTPQVHVHTSRTRQNSTLESGPKGSDSSSRSNLPYGNSRVSPLATPSVLQTKDRDSLELTRLETRHDTNKSWPSPAPGSLRRPPPMNILKMQEVEFSTQDMLNSLAPDNQDIPVEASTSDDDDKASTESNDEEEGGRPKDLPNGGDKTAEPTELRVAVADFEPEHLNLDLNRIGQNPESELQEIARPSYEPVGPRFPWTKGDLLGAGSFGTVYEAVDSDGMFFAVKEVSLVEQDKQAQQSISQLMQEIELLSQFKHDNIVQYLGTERADGKLYIFLELVSKGSLASVCKRIKLVHSQISAYTRQILKGLKYLHDQNIVHRDIKCANILVDVRGTCKLADFGMAKQIGSLDQAKSCKGSAYWMAPEVIDPKKTYGNPADIWSLGCSVLEMATGSPPFGDMEWYRVLWTVGHGNAPPIPDFLSEIAKDFIRHCLEVNPMKRPTASALLEHPFVRQAGATTPKNTSGPLSAPLVLKSLHTINEENSTDFATDLKAGMNNRLVAAVGLAVE